MKWSTHQAVERTLGKVCLVRFVVTGALRLPKNGNFLFLRVYSHNSAYISTKLKGSEPNVAVI